MARRTTRIASLIAAAIGAIALDSAFAFDSVDDERAWALTGVAIIDVRTGAEFEPFFVAVAQLGVEADDTDARRIFREMTSRGTALTPTLYIRRVWNGIVDYEPNLDDARLAEVPGEIRETFEPGLDVLANRTAEERVSDERLERISLHLTRLAADEGVTILAPHRSRELAPHEE